MKYIVYILTRPVNQYDETLTAENSGKEHKNIKFAEIERDEAMKNPAVWDAWIEKR